MQEARRPFPTGHVIFLGFLIVEAVALVVFALAGGFAFRGFVEKAMVDPQSGGWQWFLQYGGVPPGQPIGTVQTVGDAEVTVNGVRESLGEGSLTPTAGNKWLIVEVSARNTGDDSYTLSSMLQCRLRDSVGNDYPVAIGAPTTVSFDGMIAAGGVIEGEVPFEVPSTAGGLVFIFGQVFGTSRASWTLP
jgi:hypothetical protein